MTCINCGEAKCAEVADGLVLCAICENKGQWRLCRHIDTGVLTWKDIITYVVVDEVVEE